MAEISWDAFYRPAGAAPPSNRAEPGRFAFLRSWEAWLTFCLLLLVQLPVVGSLESTNWVREMPSLTFASGVGLVSGWILAGTRGRALWLHLVGIALGAVVVFGEVLRTMQLADPLDTGMRARWSEFWLRIGDWIHAAATGGFSSDPLPFVLLLVLLVWAIAYVSAWSVVRWHNVWAALVPGGFVLLTNISYLPGQPSVSFVIFLFGAVLLLARMHFLEALMRWHRERAATPDFMSVEVLFAGAWVGFVLVLAAWMIPTANHWGPVADRWVAVMQPVSQRFDRLGRLFIGVNSKKPLPAHAFTNVFPLKGRLVLSSTPLLEVTAPRVVNLRGAVYDEYTGGGWRVSSEREEALPGTTVSAASFGTPQTKAEVREPVSVTVKVVGNLPDGRLLSAGEPLATDIGAQAIVGAGPGDVIGLAPDQQLKVGESYTTVGTLSAASADTLAQTGRAYPPAIASRYTQLPTDLPPEVGQLARQIAGDAQQPYEVARRVEQYLRDNYPFDLNVPDPPPLHDAVDYFLFDSKKGYFDYHASAMAVLLRTLGIPTRVVTGFALDKSDLDSSTKAYKVTELNAWAWPEVYFVGLGWVEFNPTPTRPSATRPLNDTAALLARGGAQSGGLGPLDDPLFNDYVPDAGPLGLGLASRSSGLQIGSLIVRVLEILVGAGAVVVVVVFSARGVWEWSFRGLAPPVKRWAKVQRLTTWAGITSPATLTPLETTRGLARVVTEPRALERLAASYTASRYGGRVREETDGEARSLDDDCRRVQRGLWRLVLRRLVPRRRRNRAGVASGSTLRGGTALGR